MFAFLFVDVLFCLLIVFGVAFGSGFMFGLSVCFVCVCVCCCSSAFGLCCVMWLCLLLLSVCCACGLMMFVLFVRIRVCDSFVFDGLFLFIVVECVACSNVCACVCV